MSRLGRTYEVGEFLDSNKGKIQLDILDRPVIDHKLVGFDIAINKYEREVISERTKTALFRIKNEGKPLGNLTNLDVVRVRGHATIKYIFDGMRKTSKI